MSVLDDRQLESAIRALDQLTDNPRKKKKVKVAQLEDIQEHVQMCLELLESGKAQAASRGTSQG